MSRFGKQKDTITIEFIENGAITPFAVSEVSLEQLPETFEIETKLDIGQQQWSVVTANPNTKEEFGRTGKLRLILSKIQTIDLKDILFSLPTLNDALFEMAADSGENLLLIHEDDWRQVEFISPNYAPQINQEIQSIIKIHENHQVEIGFDQVHIRKLIEQPLIIENINLKELKQTFKIVKHYDGFGAAQGKAKDSFAFQIAEGVTFYGQTIKTGAVTFLCVRESKNSKQIAERILEHYKIVFVDWCQAKVIRK